MLEPVLQGLKAVLYTLGLDKAYNNAVGLFINATEAGYVPDFLLRRAIRFLLSIRAAEAAKDPELRLQQTLRFVEELKQMPVAINTAEANEQHYEVPTPYYLLCLGRHLKYSSCLFSSPQDTLDQAEANMLNLYCERAKLSGGQQVLELGCGWGSFSLFAAAKYPSSSFAAVSNSATQKAFIDAEALKRGIRNLKVITANMVDFMAEPSAYDRIVSIEMFEHMKNYQTLLQRVSGWLRPGGLLFVHIFVHITMPYHFEVQGEEDWMSKHFFTGGTMPSLDLLLYFQDDLAIRNHWYVNGQHYSKTLEAWLVKHDRHGREVLTILDGAYKGSKDSAVAWYNRWRMFYLACSELFNYNGGKEWGVGHYVFEKKAAGGVAPARPGRSRSRGRNGALTPR